jgi:hypothetical protein
MKALYNTLNAALDFTSPKKLRMFRSENHRLAWACLVSWIHMERHLVVSAVLDILEEMHGAAVNDGLLVLEYANVLVQTPEFRTVLCDGMRLVSTEVQRVLSTHYQLDRASMYLDMQ